MPDPVVTTNPSMRDGEAVTAAPTHGDGSPYRFEMIFSGGNRRGYADTFTELVAMLAPGYGDKNHDGQWRDRLALTVNAILHAQAAFNRDSRFPRLPLGQQSVLSAPVHETVAVPDWDCPIPLVLNRCDYQPAGNVPLPRPLNGMGPNIVWVDPSDDETLIRTLHDVAFVTVNQNSTATGDAAR